MPPGRLRTGWPGTGELAEGNEYDVESLSGLRIDFSVFRDPKPSYETQIDSEATQQTIVPILR